MKLRAHKRADENIWHLDYQDREEAWHCSSSPIFSSSEKAIEFLDDAMNQNKSDKEEFSGEYTIDGIKATR